ncbi:alpha/beta hydrolase [Pseudosulfitobacter pseudonitzschiae]|uniref:Uncharacterized protein n=1 Tax=Pseudosulfitobacter pseudonitzschiae TaxID=1402135 RepID=A0A221K675_9RHOB|nr:alpha/beta hydrolase [Pseudosulfitobacter pseudonitzschiae]ASM74499.1 hypothetical protein SULPSESMR1_04803 [Pseudosulfitobacter pseudonitzschiae]
MGRRAGNHETVAAAETYEAAIHDVLSVLQLDQQGAPVPDAFWQPTIYLDCGRRLTPLHPLDAVNADALLKAARDILENVARGSERPVAIDLRDDYLVVRVASSAPSRSAFIAVLSREDVATFLAETFPHVHLPPALQWLLSLQLAGIGLKAGAERDKRSIETRKRQSQQLRAAFEIEDMATLGRQVSNALVVALDRYVHPHHSGVGKSVAAYVDRYMPVGTRLYSLCDRDGTTFPVLDMGPLDGEPVLTLHAMALPDIRVQDIACLNDLGLRLIWPLRHGVCAPDATALSHKEHVDHALRGALMALQVLCGGRAQVLAFAAASKLGIELAHREPAAVSALHVAGVCLREGRPETGPRRLARGVLALAANRPALLDPILGQFETHLRKPGVFEGFLKRQFAESSADLSIIEAELNGPFGSRRFRDALLDSAASARHDFLFQSDLGWSRASADLPIHLHHGDKDRIHPLPLIEALNKRLPNSVLHRHQNVGQLFCHEHFMPLWFIVAGHNRHGDQAG